MKVVCQGNELSDALAKVVKALPVKKTNPILDGVKISAYNDTLTLYATDLELAIEKKINAQVLIEGETVVPGKLFADYAKKIEKETVELDATDFTKLAIRYLDSELNIKSYDAAEYPIFKEVNSDQSFIVLKKDFKECINKVSFNVAIDDSRANLKGVCLNIKQDEMEAVATDGFRLALAKTPIKNNGIITKINVPSKSINEISKLIDDGEETVTIYIDEKYIMVDLFHTKIVTRLIAEEFINYERIIPTEFTTQVTIDKNLFENAIDRISLINRSEKQDCVRLDIKEDVMNLSARSEDGEVNEKMTIGTKGKDLYAGFKCKFLLEFMHAINEDIITFNFTTSTAPGIIKGSSDNWLYLILPLRIVG